MYSIENYIKYQVSTQKLLEYMKKNVGWGELGCGHSFIEQLWSNRHSKNSLSCHSKEDQRGYVSWGNQIRFRWKSCSYFRLSDINRKHIHVEKKEKKTCEASGSQGREGLVCDNRRRSMGSEGQRDTSLVHHDKTKF